MVIKNTFLSNTDNASSSLRKLLLESCNLHTVLDLPEGTLQGGRQDGVVLRQGRALQPLTREDRAVRAQGKILASFTDRQRAFLDFVLAQYVREGVEELDQEKLSPLLKLKYHDSIPDAVADLGKPDEIGRVFVGFQKFLYQQQPTV